MKKYLLKATGIAAMAVLLSTSVFSQDEKEKIKNKVGDGDEIIIIKKGDRDARVTIEVRDGEVTVNGRPLDEYKDGDVIVRRGSRSLYNARVTPFRSQGQTWSYDGNVVNATGRAYLGVTTEKTEEGARITDVGNGTAADKAGLKEGDVITHVNDQRIETHDDLSTAIRKHKPEDKVEVSYRRDGRERQTVATLGKYPGSTTIVTPKVDVDVFNKLNEKNKLHEKNNKLNENFNFNFDNFNGGSSSLFTTRGRIGIRAQDTEDGRGVKVLSVDEGSAAEKAGLRENDVITEFEGHEINSADELAKVAKSVKDQSSMSVRIQRDGRSQTLEIRIPKKLKTANL